jgi:arylsulfatase A-like enzyme
MIRSPVSFPFLYLYQLKKIIITIGYSTYLILCISLPAVAAKPNILYIMTDDHAAHAMGAYGGRLSKLNATPNIDQLAKEGTAFTNVFTTNSICTPSRASILTGQYSQTNQVLDLNGSLPPERQYLPAVMKAAGYETAMIGKWHLEKEPAAFDFYKVLPVQGTYFDPAFLVRGDAPWPNNSVTYRGHSSDIIANQGIQWLSERKSTAPFFMMLHFKAPHGMYEYSPFYETFLADVDIPEPVDLFLRDKQFGSIATRGENDSLISEIGTSISKRNPRRNMGKELNIDTNLSDKEYTHKAYQTYLKAYLRCVKGVDDNIARIIESLKKKGQWDNTIVIYTSDQGMMLGEHDLMDKRWMYDESIRMPFIVRHPHKKKAPKHSNLLINNTDIAPFLIELAGGIIPTQMQGKSFASVLDGKKTKDWQPENWRAATYYRYWMHRAHHDVPAHFGVRTLKYKLIFFYGAHYEEKIPAYYDQAYIHAGHASPIGVQTPPGWEFYDVEKDPMEQHNVYSDKRYINIIKELKQELIKQREQYGETDIAYPHLQKIIDAHWND